MDELDTVTAIFNSAGRPMSKFCGRYELCSDSLTDHRLTSVPLAPSLFCCSTTARNSCRELLQVSVAGGLTLGAMVQYTGAIGAF